MVGKPLFLHRTTELLLDLEVAKVYTVIDPWKPLPEAMNARFKKRGTTFPTIQPMAVSTMCNLQSNFINLLITAHKGC